MKSVDGLSPDLNGNRYMDGDFGGGHSIVDDAVQSDVVAVCNFA